MISIPLNINNKRIDRHTEMRKSIDQSLSLLMTTPRYSTAIDPEFGFIFNNLRFEIFNENEGVVYNSSGTPSIFEGPEGLYNKKVTGTSQSLNTFATELKKAITEYEKRLTDVAVSMTYLREEQKIHVAVRGVIAQNKEEYQYKTTIKVWK